jgi:hypothetical protein
VANFLFCWCGEFVLVCWNIQFLIMGEGGVVFIWLMELIYVSVYLCGLTLYVRRRHKEPINSRIPWMVLLESTGWTTWCVLRGIFRGTDPPILCALDIVLPQMFLFIGTTVLFVRTLHLWCQYHVAVDSVKYIHAANATSTVNGSITPSQTPANGPLIQDDDSSSLRRSLKNNDALGNLELKLDEATDFSKCLNQKHSKAQSKLSKDVAPQPGSSYWYLVHRKWFTSKWLAIYVLICVSVQWASIFGGVFSQPVAFQVRRDSDMCKYPQTIGSWIGQGWMTISAITCLLVSYKIRVVDERLGIKTELRRVTACLAALTFFLSVNLATKRQIESDIAVIFGVNIYIPFTLVCFTSIITVVSLYQPWARTYTFETKRRSAPSSAAVEEELLVFLNDPTGFDLFQNHLQQELCVENILFFRDLELFRMKEVDALTIYENYIRESAPLSVGISSSTRTEIETHFEMIDPMALDNDSTEAGSIHKAIRASMLGTPAQSDVELVKTGLRNLKTIPDEIFDKAYKELFRNMIDPFLRFKATPEYENFMKAKRQRGKTRIRSDE